MKKRIKRLTLAAIFVILTVIVCSIPAFAEGMPSADCLVTIRANRADFEDREYFVPMGTKVPAAAFEEAETGLRSETESVYGWYLDEACTNPWSKDSDTVNENVILYADVGFSPNRVLELAEENYYHSYYSETGEGIRFGGNRDNGFLIYFTFPSFIDRIKSSTAEKTGDQYTMKTDTIGGRFTVSFSGEEVTEVDYRNNQDGQTTYFPCWGIKLDFCGGAPAYQNADFLCPNFLGVTVQPPIPGRDGNHQFAGWYTDPVGGEPVNFPRKLDSNITIYAHWRYKVTLDDNYEGGKKRIVWVDPGASVPMDFRPSVRGDGYHFNGWCDKQWRLVNYPITKPMTLWAEWSGGGGGINSKIYAVHYDTAGHGTPPNTVYKDLGAVIPQPEPEPTDDLYSFDCWCYDRFLEKPVGAGDTSKEDLWLYAKWLGPSTVYFDTQGYGTAPEDVLVKRGSLVPEPEAPSAEFMAFRGWFTDMECTQKWDFAADTVTENSLILYAGWGNEVYVGVYPGNGQDATFFPGVSGERVDFSMMPFFTNGDLEIEGYYTDSKCSARFDPERDLIPEDGLALYIKWTGETGRAMTASAFFNSSGTAAAVVVALVVVAAGVLVIVKKRKNGVK